MREHISAYGSVVMTQEELEAFSLARPFHRWLGLHVTEVDADAVTIRVDVKEDGISNPKSQSIHGGVLASIVDAAAGFAVIARLGRSAPTIDLRIDYHRVAKSGPLICKGRLINLGRNIAVAEASIYDVENRLLASGRGSYFCAAGLT